MQDSFVPAYLQLAAVLRWQITSQQLPSGHFVGDVEPMQYVSPAPGSTVTGRHVHSGEVVAGFSALARALLVPILVVQEAGRPAERYDAMRTIVCYGGAGHGDRGRN
jgi:hypothetical protein